MKVFSGRMQLVTFLILSISSSYYAIAAAEQRLRQPPLQELQQAEVNVGQKSSQKIIFGTKTATVTRLYDKVSNDTRAPAPAAATSTRQRNAANNRRAAPAAATAAVVANSSVSAATTSNVQRISRKFISHQQSQPSAQSVAQHEIPIVQKDLATNAAVAGANASRKGSQQQQQQQQRSRNPKRQRSEAAQFSSSAAQTPLLQSSGRSTNRARIVDASNSNVNPLHTNISQSMGSSAHARSRASPRTKKSTTSTTTTTSSTTTQRPTFTRNFRQNNPFNFIPQNFWSLSAPPATTVAPLPPPPHTAMSSKKIPKKYKSPIPVTPTPFDDKLIYQKPAHLRTEETPNVPKPHSNDGPFRIALPTLNFNPPTTPTKQDDAKEKGKRATVQPLRERFNCPRESEVRFQLFPKICKIDKDCSVWNRDELCCEIFGAKSCVNGMPKPLEETSHMPILGLIPRKCPTRPLAELWWDVKECDSDNDCWPRVCCPDGRRRYCRTSEPELEVVPVPVKRSFNYLTEYLECTPPPPPIFDLHPKACTSTFDCFPNVCCQEAGLRHCRPPKKSVLTLMANFLNVDFVKRLTQNIVIK